MTRVALITGGTRGIGLGIADSLSHEGIKLALCGVRPGPQLESTISTLEANGVEVLYCQCDLSKRPERAKMLESISNRFGRLDILINNAGVAPLERKDLLEATEESYERVMRTNLQGPYFLTQAVARWMIEQKQEHPERSPCIINVTSVSSTVASTNRGEYCISKAGLSMSTQLWAVRLAEYEIPVYEIRPGIIRTDMTSGVLDKYNRLIEQGLLLQSRWGMPEDVGKAATMLVSGSLGYSTGQVIMVDGGMTIDRL